MPTRRSSSLPKSQPIENLFDFYRLRKLVHELDELSLGDFHFGPPEDLQCTHLQEPA